MKKLFLLTLIIAACTARKTSENKDIAQLRAIEQYTVPFEFNSDRKMKLRAIELEGNSIIDGLRENNTFTLLGKVFETIDYVTILGYIPDDYGTPILMTFDNDGKQLSSHALYENAMGDMGRYTTNITKVLASKEINFTDSTTTRKINADGTDEIPGTDSTMVTHKTYRLTDKGAVKLVR